MANNHINKGKHLKHYQRIQIQNSLDENKTLAEISKELCKDPTTISKEIKRNRIIRKSRTSEILMKCANHKTCQIKNLCNEKCDLLCKKCRLSNCYRKCNSYTTKTCSRLSRYPHVCNGCSDKVGCKLDKYYYMSNVAQETYKTILKDSRDGIYLTKVELETLDILISPLIKKGQSLSHIYSANENKIPVSLKTLYNYIDDCYLTARNIDLRRRVKFKTRSSKKVKTVSNKEQICRINRTYEDYKVYIENMNPMNVVEMDTVEGKKGTDEPHILTLFFRNASLMLGILIEDCTKESVRKAIDGIYDSIGIEAFRQAFPVMLTDNGPEFKDPTSIEFDEEGNQRTRVFYCDPQASYQKGQIERNHEYIRYIIPKGKSFKGLNQDKVTKMMNHINSSIRPSLNNQTPFSLGKLLLHENIINELNLVEIPPNQVHLKPSLLRD